MVLSENHYPGKKNHPLKQDFCVVIPTKNEEGTIGEILDQVRSYTRSILVVDGHSNDRTLEEVKKREIPFVFESIHLNSNGFTIEQEMVLRCLKKGFRVAEIASHEYSRKSGYSKLHAAQGFYFLFHFFREYIF